MCKQLLETNKKVTKLDRKVSKRTATIVSRARNTNNPETKGKGTASFYHEERAVRAASFLPSSPWALCPQTQTQVLEILNTSQAAMPACGSGSRWSMFLELVLLWPPRQAVCAPGGKLSSKQERQAEKEGQREGGAGALT